jgi:hypothetical protein
MPGARCTRSLVRKVLVAHECSHHRYSRIHPAFPHAMVLTVSFVLSPVIGLCCHRRQRIWRAKARSGRHTSANLTPASRRQDHTTSPSASNRRSSARPFDRSQAHLRGTALPSRCAPDAACVQSIPPRVRDDRDTPLQRDETSRDIDLIWVKREADFFSRLDWTGGIKLIRRENFPAIVAPDYAEPVIGRRQAPKLGGGRARGTFPICRRTKGTPSLVGGLIHLNHNKHSASSGFGTFETCSRVQKISAYWGRPEVSG